MSFEPTQLPLVLKLVNLAGKGLSSMGLEPIGLNAKSLMDHAVKETGLSDFGDDISTYGVGFRLYFDK